MNYIHLPNHEDIHIILMRTEESLELIIRARTKCLMSEYFRCSIFWKISRSRWINFHIYSSCMKLSFVLFFNTTNIFGFKLNFSPLRIFQIQSCSFYIYYAIYFFISFIFKSFVFLASTKNHADQWKHRSKEPLLIRSHRSKKNGPKEPWI